MHRRTYFKKTFFKDELNREINLGRTCHSGIHQRYDEMSLAKTFNTITSLKEDTDLARFFHWVGKQRIQ
ncbi:MAG: hypothetical protein KTR16_12960 [Acidiferrobacterales bacterium]|nr:hypothetical protein [Acidiferrobacterales bacterium]